MRIDILKYFNYKFILFNEKYRWYWKLINKLLSLGFTNLNLLFDANPFFLNLDSFEIDEFIKEKQKDDMLLVDIIDLIDSNPYIFDII